VGWTGWYYYNRSWHRIEGAVPLTFDVMMSSPGADEFVYDWLWGPMIDAIEGLINASVKFTETVFTWIGIGMLVSTAINLIAPQFVGNVAVALGTIGRKVHLGIVRTIGDVWAATKALAGGILEAFRLFLELIHFHELLRLHEVLYMLVPKYRAAVEFIYDRIAKVSEQLGLGAAFMNLALRNARALVLSASSTIGRPYDLADLDWWTTFDKWSERANKKIGMYRDNPELFLTDLDEWVIRGAVDQQSGSQITTLATLASTAETVAGVVEDVKTVRDDFGKLVAELPAEVQKYVRPITDPIVKKFDDFYFDTYTPAVEALGIEAERNRMDIDAARFKIDELDLTISKNPVKIGDWETFEPAERRRQEEIAEDTYTAPAQRNAEVFTSVSSEETERIVQEQKAQEVPVKPTPTPEYLTYEVEEAPPPPEVYRWWEKGGDY